MAYKKTNSGGKYILKKWTNLVIYDDYGRDQKFMMHLAKDKGGYYVAYKPMYSTKPYRYINDQNDIYYLRKWMGKPSAVKGWLEMYIHGFG